jgi:enhancing lycopene biosynthesis protein 2
MKVAIILSGCGAMDGTEISEGVSLLLAFSKLNIKYQCFSVDKNQGYVYDHLKGKIADGETRNALTESSRLAVGRVLDVKSLKLEDFDGLAFPGGYGVLINLSNFLKMQDAINYLIDEEIKNIISSFYKAKKPMYFLCSSPTLLSQTGTESKILITLGDSKNSLATAFANILNLVSKTDNSPVVDNANKIVSTPCYMIDDISLAELYEGIYDGAKKFKALL